MLFENKKKRTDVILYVLGIAFWVLVWYVLAVIANRKLILKIPLPFETVKMLAKNIGQKTFWQSVGASLLHIVTGYVSAAVIGVAFGMTSGHSRVFKALSMPLRHLIRSVPVAAFIIIAWLWIPSGILPAFIAGLMVLPIIWSHTDAALASIDVKLVEMAKVSGMSRKDVIFMVKLPLMAPNLREGSITALGIAWKSGIAAEVICNPSGTLGALLQSAKTSIEYDRVFAVTLMIVLLSLLLENVLKIAWKEQKR